MYGLKHIKKTSDKIFRTIVGIVSFREKVTGKLNFKR